MRCWLSSTLLAKDRPQSSAVLFLCVHTELEKYALKMAPSGTLSQLLLVQVRSRGGRWCWTHKRAQKRSRAGRWSWAWELDFFSLQLSPNGGATDIVFVTLFCIAVETAIAWYGSCCTMLGRCCSGGGPRQPWSSGLAPVSRFHSSVPLFPLIPVPNRPTRFHGH